MDDETFRQLKERAREVPLPDVMASYGISIHWKKPDDAKIQCPFPDHADDHPSFRIRKKNGTWLFICSCHRGGDVVKFVSLYENIPYVEALKKLVGGIPDGPLPIQGSAATGFRDPLESGNERGLYRNATFLYAEYLAQCREVVDRETFDKELEVSCEFFGYFEKLLSEMEFDAASDAVHRLPELLAKRMRKIEDGHVQG